MGSSATPAAIAMAGTVADAETPQFMFSPAVLQAGKDNWTFRLPQSTAVMSHAILAHMAKQGVKTVGFLGYTDAYGESWLRDFQAEAKAMGLEIKIIATERFARNDTSVTAQALKLNAANPDAMLIVASGSGAAMPHKAMIERGYKGKIYQTHAAATKDLMRIGGKDVEGAFVVSGPCVIAEQLPDSHPSKKTAIDFVQKYEKAYGAGSRNQFAGHAYDAVVVLEKIIPVALKKGKPGTPAFRAALKDATEAMGRTVVSHGVLNYTKDNHWGFTTETGVILKVVNGDWKVE
jgi:branched-chain amino acid transport system substrate-binding protein